jgi:amino acid adenylation domain-containing protein
MSRQNIEDIYELSPLQRGMLFHTLFAPASRLFVEQESFPLHGQVDVGSVVRAWEGVVERHPALRTSFHWEGLEKPVQVVHQNVQLPVDVQDWRMLRSDVQDERLHSYLSSIRQQGFDLTKAPLLRLAVFELGEEVVQFVLSFHHILLDGWSSRVLTHEVWSLYEAYCEGKDLRLPPARPYSDFIAWLQQQDQARAEVYWRRVLKGFSAPTRLGIDRPTRVSGAADADHGEQSVRLSKRTSEALRSVARENRLTLNTVIQGAWAFVLSRYSGDIDVCFGTVVSGRPATLTGVESMVGLFINTLPLRTQVLGESLPIPWLKTLQAQQLGARDYEYAELVDIQRWSDVSPGIPLFDSIVIFENYPSDHFTEEDDGAEEGFRCFEKSNYPVNLMVMPGRRIDLKILFSRERFDDASIGRMLNHVRQFLEELVSNPDRRLAAFQILTPAERRQMLVEWNATDAELPRVGVQELFEAQVERTPGATALICEDETITYAELNSRSNRLASHLRVLGVGPEVLVGICIDRSIDFVVALLATFKAGGAYLPLDPSYPKERLAFMLDDAGIRVLLTLTRLESDLPTEGRTVLRLDVDRELLAQCPESNLAHRSSQHELAYVIYTSGSTGRPKGVAVEHGQIVNRLRWMWSEYPFAPDEIGCQKTAANFVDSIWELLGPLLKGIPTVIIRDEVLQDPNRLVEELGRRRVSRLWLVPSLLHALLDRYADLQDRLPLLRFWVTSGEALTPELLRRFRATMPSAELYNLYGTSEVWDATWFDPKREPLAEGEAPIGRPIFNVQTYVLDGQMQPVPIGVAGELHVGGIGLARGYVNRPELTAAKFVPHPFNPGPDARLYKTGDLARYLPDGNIQFLGRLDRQLKIRGFRVEPGEIEAVLVRHPGVRQASVVSRDDNFGQPLLVAYVVPDRDCEPSKLGGGASSWEKRIRDWHEVWDGIYDNAPQPDEAMLDLVGWNSSYTGLPIPADEMRECVNRSVERLQRLGFGEVLDVGCGAGLLLLPCAQQSSRYCGTDLSAGALRHVEAQLRKLNLAHVSLLQRAADDFSGFDAGSFDLVILNSVTQYFPNIDYLVAVVGDAATVLRRGGAIYLGAVRSLPLLEVFHLSVELQGASNSLSIGKLRQRIRRRMNEDEELVIDPAFFFALKNHVPRISRVQIEPKRGHFQNELTRFRYEVVLHLDSAPDESATEGWLDWQREGMTITGVERMIREGKRDKIAIARIPNRRLTGELKALKLLATLHERDTVADLRAARAEFQDPGIDPEEVWKLQDKGLCTVDLRWSGPDADECLHALVCRRGLETRVAEGPARLEFPAGDSGPSPWTAYANNPLRHQLPQVLESELRRYVRSELPEYMVPATFVFLDSLPLTPSGKLDQSSLPAPDRSRPEKKAGYIAPRTQTEHTLAGQWSELLGVDRVSAHDNFFQLGGHSLLAMRLLSRLREAFRLELPLRTIFEAPTVAELAQRVEERLAHGNANTSPEIVRLSRDAHIATMLPGGALDPADLSKGRRIGLPPGAPGD